MQLKEMVLAILNESDLLLSDDAVEQIVDQVHRFSWHALIDSLACGAAFNVPHHTFLIWSCLFGLTKCNGLKITYAIFIHGLRSFIYFYSRKK